MHMKIDARTIDTGAHAYIPPWSRTSAVASGGFLLGRGGATCTGFTNRSQGHLLAPALRYCRRRRPGPLITGRYRAIA